MSALDQRLRETLAESSAGLHGSGLYGLKSYWDERYERQPMKRGVGMWFEEWYAPYVARAEARRRPPRRTRRRHHRGVTTGRAQLAGLSGLGGTQ